MGTKNHPFQIGRLILPLGFGLLLLMGWIASLQAFAATAAPQNTLNRPFEPVVMRGSDLASLNGLPIDELFVYASNSGMLEQIPAQVDEKDSGDRFTANEDGSFDNNDELVIMSGDAGDQLATEPALSDLLQISDPWYEVEINDPLAVGNKAWIYVVHSTALTKSFSVDYVDFDGATHALIGQTYRLEFDTPNPWVDHLTLGAGSTDILDRNKSRFECANLLFCPITEEIGGVQVQDDVITDGPVRAIIRNGRVLGYGDMLSWSTGITIPSFLLNNATLQLSLDFSPAATGSTLYNAAVPSGVTVDGVTDTVPALPASAWIQLSSSEGTMIQVADLSRLQGTITNYYEDNSAIDPDDTGDGQRFGATGILITDPSSFVEYVFNIYTLTGAQPNRGAEFEAYFTQPLTISATEQLAPKEYIYLPIIVRE